MAFFVLTFVLTWSALIPWYANAEGIPWFTFGSFAAALVLSALTGGWRAIKGLLAKIAHWRVGIVWYLVALGLPLAISVRYLGKVFAEPDHTQQQWIAVALWALVALAILAVAGTARFGPRYQAAGDSQPA